MHESNGPEGRKTKNDTEGGVDGNCCLDYSEVHPHVAVWRGTRRSHEEMDEISIQKKE